MGKLNEVMKNIESKNKPDTDSVSMCKDHNEPLKFCHKCEEVVAKEIFKRIWDLEFDGLDKQLTPEMEKILAKFWETMQNLRREYISDDYWNGGKDV